MQLVGWMFSLQSTVYMWLHVTFRFLLKIPLIMQVLLVNSTYAELVRDMPIVRNTMDQSDDITQLVPSDGGDYIYALTAQQVSYILVT